MCRASATGSRRATQSPPRSPARQRCSPARGDAHAAAAPQGAARGACAPSTAAAAGSDGAVEDGPGPLQAACWVASVRLRAPERRPRAASRVWQVGPQRLSASSCRYQPGGVRTFAQTSYVRLRGYEDSSPTV
ncbi:hypothetical protein PHLGIDRAFT_391765 [Phlebiopsis gigantea 11061_1 CR5-6]|uniref:Uncharacterized protein n=1 Tax=Phlebiopsis gigantea (strain 11061_1 CR5-6) TaxID=745531 RepID=A0A0C3S991_PHLG1|nr:hypothetical protein PHLGIDRAFT_391765 [Phlebiopsis gigantea 11061_1 CR5-6]